MNTRLIDRFSLTGRRALVTGAGTGMGKEFARVLAEAGATVMIAARDELRLKRAAEEISSSTGGTIHYRAIDLSDREQAASLVHYAQEVMGGVDILVCNAAGRLEAGREFGPAFDKLFAVNFGSNVWMTRAAIPGMKKNRWGRVIFITSVVSRLGSKKFDYKVYASSKAALEGYATSLAAEVGTDGITVNCVAPGAFRTETQAASYEASSADTNESDARMAYVASMNAMNRWARPEEIAGLVLLLASDAGSYITGVRYVVDGGWSSLSDTDTVAAVAK